ncbi:SGNH hydrolase-type esterase domain-containing protein [Xylariales sp. PMI_506]|nr:SGNH hydrolase-type esterase domain-containing protein [Xylariales sp. PMI_506]
MLVLRILAISCSASLVYAWPFDYIWSPPGSQQILGPSSDEPPSSHRPAEWPKVASSSLSRRPRNGFVALGDSYSAGIGTGFEGSENDCRQGLGAHPVLVARDLLAGTGGANSSGFQFESCTGSTTAQLLVGGVGSQIDSLNASRPADFALLSVGGNDLGFFEVMNACIFRFYNFYSGTCETALAHTQERLDSDDFENRLRIVIIELLNKVKWEKKPWFQITITGYARFFNDETDDCDEMSLGVWWRGPKLKKELRVRMNAMVQAVNRKIESTVAAINAGFTTTKVLFVDYDLAFDGHRFCEPGVAEPDYARNDTWFFLVGAPDNARNGTTASSSSSSRSPPLPLLPPSASELVDPATCLGPARRSGDWGRLAMCYMAMSRAEDPMLRLAGGEIAAENSMWYVPTYYGKTFHPRSRGHEAIRNRIYAKWAEEEKEEAEEERVEW